MSEWWTYRLRDFLMFSARTYDRLFERYNRDVWPLHVVMLVAGVAILLLLARHGRDAGAILAACWLWVAWAFHWKRYATIHSAATWFAAVFVIEALLLIWTGVIRDQMRGRQRFGIALFAFALIVQPLIGLMVGRPWIRLEIFGIAPDPTVVATLGVCLFARRRALTIIPLLWCAISGATLWTLHAPDALLLPIAGAVAVIVALKKP